MNKTLFALVSLGVLLGAGCGGTSTFSCDRTSGTSGHICIDYDAVSGDVSESQAQCTASQGTVGTTCSRSGIVGGCRVTAPAGETGTVTTWYYSGTAASVMTSCGSFSTYVGP